MRRRKKGLPKIAVLGVAMLIALGLMGVLATAFLSGLSTSAKSVLIADERTTAGSLAQSQMEYVKEQIYDAANNPPQYSIMASIPPNFVITVDGERLDPDGDGTSDDDGLQKITVTVSYSGEQIITLVNYKANK